MSQFQGPQGQQPFQQPPFQPQPPAKKRRLGWLKATGVGLLTFVVGVAIGAGGDTTTTTTTTQPAPTVTTTVPGPEVTKSVPGPATTKTVPGPTVTKTVTKTEVPQACLDAIDNAEEGFTYAAAAMQAASDFDLDAIEAATAKLNKVAPKWQTNKALCRAIAEK